jgi:hypothetical protein
LNPFAYPPIEIGPFYVPLTLILKRKQTKERLFWVDLKVWEPLANFTSTPGWESLVYICCLIIYRQTETNYQAYFTYRIKEKFNILKRCENEEDVDTCKPTTPKTTTTTEPEPETTTTTTTTEEPEPETTTTEEPEPETTTEPEEPETTTEPEEQETTLEPEEPETTTATPETTTEGIYIKKKFSLVK